MSEILDGLIGAFDLLFSLDKETYEIIGLSIYVSLMSTTISALIGIPTGIIIALKEFKLKGLVVRILYTLMSIPPVIVGLVVFLTLSRKGPLGSLSLLFTPIAMIIAQVLLVTPIITGSIYNSTKIKGPEVLNLSKVLGASKIQSLFILISEMRIGIFSGIVSGYGRAVSEVGAVMIVGGNIRGSTRVMTTSISMLQNMGDYSNAIALGIVLLGISFIINGILYSYQKED